jgi:hypothetical protein
MDGLLDTKKEYTDHLIDILIIPISQKIYSLYEECINEKKNLVDFQKKLNNIKNWNNNIIKEEYENIKKKSKCNYIPKLLKTIFITSIKIKIFNYENKKITLKSPSVEDFIHKCYINCSIFSWKNAYLFWNHQTLKSSEKQYHLNLIEKNFKKIIKNTIRDIIPIEEILEQINNEEENEIKNNEECNLENDIEEEKEGDEEGDDEEGEGDEEEDDDEEESDDKEGNNEEEESDDKEGNNEEDESDDEKCDEEEEGNNEEESDDEKCDEEEGNNEEESDDEKGDIEDNDKDDNKEEGDEIEKEIVKDDKNNVIDEIQNKEEDYGDFNDLKNIDLSSVDSDSDDNDSIDENIIETKKIDFHKSPKNAFF